MNGPAAMLGPGPPDIGVKKPIKKSASTSVTVPRHSHSMRRRSAQAYSTEGQPGVVRKEGQTAHTPSHTSTRTETNKGANTQHELPRRHCRIKKQATMHMTSAC